MKVDGLKSLVDGELTACFRSGNGLQKLNKFSYSLISKVFFGLNVPKLTVTTIKVIRALFFTCLCEKYCLILCHNKGTARAFFFNRGL